MLCPIIFDSNTIELNMHTSCYLGLGLTLCYLVPPPAPASYAYLYSAFSDLIIKGSLHKQMSL